MPITVETSSRTEVVDVTDRVAATIPADADDGVCSVFVTHTTAGVAVNEPEPRLLDDVTAVLERLIPAGEGYGHDTIDDNAAAHLRSMLAGSAVTLPIRDGALALGTWQAVLFLEFDGPRRRELVVTTTPA